MAESEPQLRGKKVIVSAEPAILGMGIQSVLGQLEDCQVIILPCGNCEQLVAAIEEQHPDILMLDAKTLAEYFTRFPASFNSHAETRIVLLDLQDNNLLVLERKLLKLKKSTDLYEVL